MSRFGLLVAALLAVAIPGWASEASLAEQFERANAAFAEGNFEEAIKGYRAIAEEDGVSASLLYDLGNAELRAGRPGWAILEYERALALEPRNPDIAANLRRARQMANLPDAEPAPWETTARALTVDEWAWTATAALAAACLVACGLLIAARRAPPRARARWSPRVVVGVLLLVCASAWALGWTRLRQLDEAVIVAPDPVLRSAPYESASPSGELLPGELVRVERQHEDFRLIRTAEGKAGWVPAAVAPQIVPRAPDS